MKVTRFVHIRAANEAGQLLPKGGATILIDGDTNYVGQVDVRVAFCSKKDNYIKARGREEAAKAPIKVVPLRYLGKEIQRIKWEVERRLFKNVTSPDEQMFDFTIKYFLPKE